MENSDFVTISLNDSSELSSTSNVYIPGRWAFPVHTASIGHYLLLFHRVDNVMCAVTHV